MNTNLLQLVSLLEDTTYLKCKKSNDPSYQVLVFLCSATMIKLPILFLRQTSSVDEKATAVVSRWKHVLKHTV